MNMVCVLAAYCADNSKWSQEEVRPEFRTYSGQRASISDYTDIAQLDRLEEDELPIEQSEGQDVKDNLSVPQQGVYNQREKTMVAIEEHKPNATRITKLIDEVTQAASKR